MTSRQTQVRHDQQIIGIVLAGSSNLQHWPVSRINTPVQFQKTDGRPSSFQRSINAIDEATNQPVLYITVSAACLDLARSQVAELNRDHAPVLIVEPVERGTYCSFVATVITAAGHNRNATIIAMDALHPPEDIQGFKRLVDQLSQHPLTTEHIILCCRKRRFSSSSQALVRGKAIGKNHLFHRSQEKAVTPDKIHEPAGLIFTSPRSALKILSQNNSRITDTCSVAMQASHDRNGNIWPDLNTWSGLPNLEFNTLAEVDNSKILIRPIDLAPTNEKQDNLSTHRLIDNGHLIAIEAGIDIEVISSPDATLVRKKEQSGDLNELLKSLRDTNRPEIYDSLVQNFNWGRQTEIESLPGSSVKRLEILPGQTIESHFHNHRCETWHCMSGTGSATIDQATFDVDAGTNVTIPHNAIHSISNSGDEMLVLLEIRAGAFLSDEDSIKTIMHRAPHPAAV